MKKRRTAKSAFLGLGAILRGPLIKSRVLRPVAIAIPANESPIPVQETPSTFHRFAQRNAFHRGHHPWALIALLVSAAPAFAQTTVWTDATGSWFNSGNWSAGVPDSNTTADINNGGTAQIMSSGAAASEVDLGVGAQDSGTLSTSGSGNLQDGNSLYVGRSGTGNLNITNGGTISSGRFIIGENSGSNGSATISGSGSMWTNLVINFVGYDGTATLNITNGGQLSDMSTTSVGEDVSSTGTVTVDGPGSLWSEQGEITIGNAGSGTLTISNGGHVFTGGSGGSFGSAIGNGTNGLVTVNGGGSNWTNQGPLALGQKGGNGTLHIMNGGVVSNGYCVLGALGGSGTVTVDGVGSTWTISGDVSVGDVSGGVGTMTISQGGHITSADGLIADGSSSTGNVQVDGAGSTWTNSANVYVGGTASGAVGTGALHLTNGGTVSATAATVWSTGTVTGNGLLQTNNGVTNQGTIAPDQTISITGNLTFSSAATMLSTVTPNTVDNVTVQGTTALNGDLGLTLTGSPFIVGMQYTLLQASGGLNGSTFSNVFITAPPGVNAQVTYDTNHVYLVIEPSGTPTPTATPTATVTATATVTPIPTPRATPTARPVPSRITPTPTATGTPSPTPTPILTPRPRSTPRPRP